MQIESSHANNANELETSLKINGTWLPGNSGRTQACCTAVQAAEEDHLSRLRRSQRIVQNTFTSATHLAVTETHSAVLN